MALHKNDPRISDAMMVYVIYVMTELHSEQYEVAFSIDPSTNKRRLSIIAKKKISQMALGIDVSIFA